MGETTKEFARCTACGKGWPDVRFRIVGGGILCERCDTPSSASQAPVAGADPRAWREMAARVEGYAAVVVVRNRVASGVNREATESARAVAHSAAAALRAAAEAVTDLGARLDRAVEIARERNEDAYRAEAAAARGAEGEQAVRAAWLDGVSAHHWSTNPATTDVPRWAERGPTGALREAVEWEAAANRYLATLAPRPSAGPAGGAWEGGVFPPVACPDCGVSPATWRPVRTLYVGFACEACGGGVEGEPAARASDDPAPTTEGGTDDR